MIARQQSPPVSRGPNTTMPIVRDDRTNGEPRLDRKRLSVLNVVAAAEDLGRTGEAVEERRVSDLDV